MYNKWKHALGNILAYNETYPNHTKYIYLFDVPKKNKLIQIRQLCEKFDVKVK